MILEATIRLIIQDRWNVRKFKIDRTQETMSDEFGLQEGILYTTKISRAKRIAQFGRMKTNHPIHPRAMSPKAVKEARLKSTMKRKRKVLPLASLL